uniref:Photosystem I assembly protein Ycf4 n=1 Tax=Staurocarteria crucifera TaxID=47781 RepID=A0A0S2IC67_9CHLO|nr:hypothetical chloroplast RF4 [Carteria crucifera]
MTNQNIIRRYIVIGERRFSNYWWAIVFLIGSMGFLLTGISSYLGQDLLPIIHSESINFFPQGLLMCFYGSLAFLLSLYWWLLILWNVGGGFSEIDFQKGYIRIFRWGYPGKNRRIDLQYPIKDVEAIKIEQKFRTILIRLKGKREIPFIGTTEPLTLKLLETQASELASFLDAPLEGF